MENEVMQVINLLKDTTPMVYNAALKEALVSAWMGVMISVLFLIGSPFALLIRRINPEDSDYVVAAWLVFVILLGISLFAFLCNLHSLLTIEYESLKSVVQLLQ